MESEKYIQILDDYRITADKMNIVLQEKYEKKDGKGKNAKGTGEYDWKDIGYHNRFDTLAKSLVNKEIIKSIHNVDSFPEILIHIEKLEKQITNYLKDKVILNREREKDDS